MDPNVAMLRVRTSTAVCHTPAFSFFSFPFSSRPSSRDSRSSIGFRSTISSRPAEEQVLCLGTVIPR